MLTCREPFYNRVVTFCCCRCCYCCSYCCYTVIYSFLPLLALPNITMPIPGTVVRTVAGHWLLRICEATGTPPVYTAIVWNSTVLFNKTNTVDARLYEEGNYYCVATNYYGTDTRVIPVVIIGKNFGVLFCAIRIIVNFPCVLSCSLFGRNSQISL